MPTSSLPTVTSPSPELAQGQAGPRRVLLVCPPFQHPQMASLATTLLATFLRSRGGSATEAYLHFHLEDLLGREKYLAVGDGTSLTGELLFAEGLHGEPEEPEIRALLDGAFGPASAREEIRCAFEERVFTTLDAAGFDVVGFTTTFNQLMSALWLARGMKQRHPDLVVALGGAACAAPMGARVLEGYPHVDVVVSGWGEAPLLALSRGEVGPRTLVECYGPVDLDGLPVPEYETFLEAARAHPPERQLSLAFESSRGCWWGQKHHCRFCGVNGPSRAYQAKSSPRVVSEVRSLWDRYGKGLLATDAVLSREHLEEALPELARFERGPTIFYELRTNVSEAQMVVLARARVQGQPGIESLSTRLLELMGKGLSAIQNLAFLKWAAERHVPVSWNLLYAIPGERTADYDQQIALIQRIPHFSPARRINPIHLAQHSPYFDDYAGFGWTDVKPLVEYSGMHPHLDEPERFEIAKYFQGRAPASPEEYRDRLDAALREWTRRHLAGDGLFLDPERGLIRNEAGQGQHFPSHPILDAVLAFSHEITSIGKLLRETGATRDLLTRMEAAGLVYIERDRVLNLAVRIRLEPRAG